MKNSGGYIIWVCSGGCSGWSPAEKTDLSLMFSVFTLFSSVCIASIFSFIFAKSARSCAVSRPGGVTCEAGDFGSTGIPACAAAAAISSASMPSIVGS